MPNLGSVNQTSLSYLRETYDEAPLAGGVARIKARDKATLD